MAKNPQKGVIGLVITITIKDQDGVVVNVSGATAAGTKNILLEKPGGVVVTKAAVFVNDGTDGKIKYTTIAGDIDFSGLCTWQADITITGFTGKSSKHEIIFEDNVGE